MTQTHPTGAQTPISDRTIRRVAQRNEIPAAGVRTLLTSVQTAIDAHGLVPDFDDIHEQVGERDGVRIYLCDHGTEVDELASHVGWDTSDDLPQSATPESLVRQAMDYEARTTYADLFGSEQDAVTAVGAADALVVQLPDTDE